ncbi:hypothetical protein ACN6MY_03750 [Peribacillus sp. B-H-3]|uniref:hypothetical protein n=1 Tax=Peribacillus sp. B-H-3 TaxID=3400420 RepID=UPI003B012122
MTIHTQVFEAFERRLLVSLHTLAPARVISFDESKQTADVELLFLSVDKDGDKEKYAPIQDVPVLGMRYKIYHPIKATINGLMGVHGGVDGSAAVVNLEQEIECKPFLKKDDVVFVGFAERALDHLDGPKAFDPEFNRTHDVRDAFVLGVRF